MKYVVRMIFNESQPLRKNMKQNLTRLYLCALSLFLCVNAQADEPNKVNIHLLCEQSPAQCIQEIDTYLEKEVYRSRIWFQYKLYQLDALFELMRHDALYDEVNHWVTEENIPLKFKISTHIYYAKLLEGNNANEQAYEYLEKAIATLQEVNEVSPDPMLLVQIANALNSLGRYQQGYDLLFPLVAKYQHRYMPKFKHELNENLGHFAYRLGDLQGHLQYRLHALEWASKLANKVQVAISTYNVARAYQMLKEYDQAFEHFLIAEKMASMGESDQNMIWFRRAEMFLAQGHIEQATAAFERVNRQSDFAAYIQMFNEFETKIKAAQIQ